MIHTDEKCIFNYCPDPRECKASGKCRHPRKEKKDEKEL